MRKIILAAMLALCQAPLAHAGHDDLPGADWMPIEQAIAALHAAGFGTIAEVEAEDGFWKAKAVKDGVLYKIKLEPRHGQVATAHPDRD